MKTVGGATHLRLSLCPYCGKELDAATNMSGDAAPEPGDTTVCIGCIRVLIFNTDLTPRKPQPGELEAAFAADPAYAAYVRRVQRAIALTAAPGAARPSTKH